MKTGGVSDAFRRIDEIQKKISSMLGQSPDGAKPDPSASFASVMANATGENASSAPESLRPIIDQVAARYNIPPKLLESVARRESSFNSRAVSPKGAQGIMQIMPETQQLLGVTDPFDAGQSIDGGGRYLRMMLDRYNGDVRKALAAYNAGPGAVDNYGGVPPYTETRNYVSRILADFGDESAGE
ncbi:MAG: lytic transglycosylase domain-containing protein [Candidatus Hydrogenedentota bacterium]